MKERSLIPPGASRRKSEANKGSVVKIFFLLLISASLFALTIFGFEFLFSPYNTLPLNGVADGKRYTWGHLVENNRYGFRERDFKTPKPPDVYRVMVLGDSLTWGAGLAVDERYTAIAEKLLNDGFPQKKFEVLNFGIPRGPTTKERDILQELHQEVEPDLIAVGFCLNDPQPKPQYYSIERQKLTNSIMGQAIDKTSYLLADLGLLYTAKLLNDAFYRFAEKLGIIPDANVALGRAYDPLSSEWRSFVQALTDIKKISDERGLLPPVFAILNRAGGRNKLRLQWFHQVQTVAAQLGFLAYDHELEIAGQLGNKSSVINKLDGHPSASVNRIYGEKLYQAVARPFAKWP
jgi:lysophospholipase L1-like esterase